MTLHVQPDRQLMAYSLRISFKRRTKQASFLPRFLSNPLEGIRRSSPSPAPTPSRRHQNHSQIPPAEDAILNALDTSADNMAHFNGTKDGGPLDWYVEGPGRRVGYDDLTAIDWIFEYTKERQRLRVLQSNAKGLLGYAAQLVDASQIWLVLIATGVAAGVLAAGIDIASDWLGDLKMGYCKSGPEGGMFYLNKGFCCWGLEGRASYMRDICISRR
jgi:chloride channel 3/4/5